MHFFTRHSVDMYNARYISGWVFRSFQKNRPVALRFFSGDREIGRSVADRYRKDLQTQKVHPTGLCGFDYNFPQGFDITENRELSVYLDDDTKPFLQLATSHLPPVADNKLPPILFMHIPKTAGTSFNAFMRMHVPYEAAESHIERFTADRLETLGRTKRYLAGHLPVSTLKEHFSVTGYDCYSLVRLPYDHLHSHLNWLKGIAEYPRSRFFTQHSEAVRRLAVKVRSVDFTKLNHVKKFVFDLKEYELDFFDNCQTRYFLDYRPEKVSRSDFQHILENISLFKYVGLTEEFDEFKKVISRSYGLPWVSLPHRLNKAVCPRLFDRHSKEIQEILFPLVHTDLLLYAYIKNRYSFGRYDQ